MAIIANELTFWKSIATSTGQSNNTGGVGTTIYSLGGAISTDQLVSGSLHDLFDAVPSLEATNGRTEYRCIYLKNENISQTLYDSKLYILSNTPSVDSTIEIALDPAGANADSVTVIVDEIDSTGVLAAAGITFSAPADLASALSVGDIDAESYHAVWVKRVIDAGAEAAQESATLSWVGDTDA